MLSLVFSVPLVSRHTEDVGHGKVQAAAGGWEISWQTASMSCWMCVMAYTKQCQRGQKGTILEFPNLNVFQSHPPGLLKHCSQGPIPRVFSLEWDLHFQPVPKWCLMWLARGLSFEIHWKSQVKHEKFLPDSPLDKGVNCLYWSLRWLVQKWQSFTRHLEHERLSDTQNCFPVATQWNMWSSKPLKVTILWSETRFLTTRK